jgi:uncharacterized protein YecE (DUF72 family)
MKRPEIIPEIPPVTHDGCRLLLGTSGYSYTEWIDAGFYPRNTRTSEMLPLYAHTFSVVELNYTWYQMARSDAMERMAARVPANFKFTTKLTRTLTHERDDRWRDQLHLFTQGITPLAPQLQAILVQLPPDFTRSVANRKYLADLLDGLEHYPVAVEFRHRSWAVDPVFAELERRRVSLVCVDEPSIGESFPALDVVTNPDLIYVRFHGRNITGWRSTNMQKKFDYNYSREELLQWHEKYLNPLCAKADTGLVFFNNHVRGQAPANARKLNAILQQSEHPSEQ